jgi:hypothetical protein
MLGDYLLAGGVVWAPTGRPRGVARRTLKCAGVLTERTAQDADP